MKAKLTMFLFFCLAAKMLFAQSTYNFENATVGTTAFADQGVGFTITTQSSGSLPFKVREESGLGWNGIGVDNKFIDNLEAKDNNNIKFTVTANQNINLKRMYLYLADNTGGNISVAGTCKITGRMDATEVFTATANSGFNTSLGINNGFTLINLSTYGGADNSTKTINNFIVETTGGFEYVALDALTWSTATVLPVTFLGYDVFKEAKGAKLQWQTSSESDNKGFVIYRSGDDRRFVKIGEVSAAIGNQLSAINYSYIDKQPLNGNNYYKLVQVDNDGTATELGVKLVAFNLQLATFNVYPNPSYHKVDIAFVKGRYNLLILSSADGKVLQKIALQPNEVNVTLDLSAYTKGVYFAKLLGNDDSITQKVIKQ